MEYIPIDLYRGSFDDLNNSSVMQNPNAMSIVGDSYTLVGEDLYIGKKSLTAQKFVVETSLGVQSLVSFDSVENASAGIADAAKGFLVTGYKRDSGTGSRLVRIRNIIESDLPKNFEELSAKLVNASVLDASIIKCSSTATVKALKVLDSSLEMGYKEGSYVFDSSYFLDVSSYTSTLNKPYIKSERSKLYTKDNDLHRGTKVENLTHSLESTDFNKNNFGFKTFHEYYLTALDSSLGYSPNNAQYTDPVDASSDDIEVMLEEGTYVGDYCNEMKIIASQTSVYDVLKTLLQKRVPPVYVGPTHSTSASGFGTYEVGSSVSIKISTAYTNPTPAETGATKDNGYASSRFDALTSKYNLNTRHGGDLLTSAVTKSGTSGLFTNPVESASTSQGVISGYTFSGTIGQGSMTFSVTANTSMGPVLKDNFLEFNAVDDHTAYSESGLYKAKGFYSTVDKYGYAKQLADIKMPSYETAGAHGASSVGSLSSHNNTYTWSSSVSGQYKYYICSSNDKFDDVTWSKAAVLASNIIKSGFVSNSAGTLSVGSTTFPKGCKQMLVFAPHFFTQGSLTQIKNELGVDETVSFVNKGTVSCGGVSGNDSYLVDYDMWVYEANAGTTAAVTFPTFIL